MAACAAATAAAASAAPWTSRAIRNSDRTGMLKRRYGKANSGNKETSLQPELSPKSKLCEQKLAILAEHVRFVNETERAAKEYRQIMTAGMETAACQVMCARIESLRAE